MQKATSPLHNPGQYVDAFVCSVSAFDLPTREVGVDASATIPNELGNKHLPSLTSDISMHPGDFLY
jgi:hypothetical protein